MNQSTRAWWGFGSASHDTGMVSNVVELLVSKEVVVVKMGCTSFSLYGKPRSPRLKEGYDTPRFKQRRREIAKRHVARCVTFWKGGRSRLSDVDAYGGHKLGPMLGGFAAHARSCYHY